MEEFLGFVESLFEIENEELFKKDENKIIEKNKIFSEEMFISPESFSDPNETYYETFGIDIDFNLEDLNKALENKVKSIQRMYDGDDAEIRKQTAKAYSKGYFYGLDLQDKADVMLNGR